MNITLDDIANDSEFVLEGTTYIKGGSGTYGADGYTICYPYLGGKIQRNEKFEAKIPNNSPVRLTNTIYR